MKILITGGAGYIGSFMVKAAIDKGLTHAIKVRGDYSPEAQALPSDVTIIKEQKYIYILVDEFEKKVREELEK